VWSHDGAARGSNFGRKEPEVFREFRPFRVFTAINDAHARIKCARMEPERESFEKITDIVVRDKPLI